MTTRVRFVRRPPPREERVLLALAFACMLGAFFLALYGS